jgi:hypothetical protein
MSPFHGQSQPATNLSLLADQDEPLELMIELEKIARERMAHRNKSQNAWDAVAEHAADAVRELKVLNEPKLR